jgi:hypothetical protein
MRGGGISKTRDPLAPVRDAACIFEYGVSESASGDAGSHRGQGLFAARTYMAKMGGTVEAVNCEDGVEMVLGEGVLAGFSRQFGTVWHR